MESPSGSHSTFFAALQPLFGGEGQPSGVQSHGTVAEADAVRARRTPITGTTSGTSICAIDCMPWMDKKLIDDWKRLGKVVRTY
jgi:hypothetical protein